MAKQQIIIPFDQEDFIIEGLRQRLDEGHTVRISFGGTSMLPMIDGRKKIYVHLEPLSKEPRVGQIYLFLSDGHCVVHRLMRIEGDCYIFRGDNCIGEERVKREDVLAKLKAVEHSDGRMELCDTTSWHRRSRWVVARRSFVNALCRTFSRHNRRWMRWVYFAFLIILMWAPMGLVGIPLNNFVLGIRLDHILHASVYIPCAFFLMDFNTLCSRRPGFLVWIVGIAIGITTEMVQYILPYRGFDINDLVANFLGVTLGWIIIHFLKK